MIKRVIIFFGILGLAIGVGACVTTSKKDAETAADTFQVSKPIVCLTEPVGYRQYEEAPSNRVFRLKLVFFYMELKNITVIEDPLYGPVIYYSIGVQIFNSEGTQVYVTLFDNMMLPLELLGTTSPKEVYTYYYCNPSAPHINLSDGEYTIKFTVADVKTGAIATTSTVIFTIVSGVDA